MRLLLTLHSNERKPIIPINYQYPLSAAIYKIIYRADADYATFLHNTGYSKECSGKQFKFFTFSDIRAPFAPPFNDRLYLKSQEMKITICFHVPLAAENFVKGLFMHQQLDIADRNSRASFTISQVEVLDTGLTTDKNSLMLRPLSPIVVGKKNDKGHYDYRNPLEEDYIDCLLFNWIEKYQAAYPQVQESPEELYKQISMAIQPLNNPPQERKPIIKAGTAAASKLRGYTRFHLQVTASHDMIELALNAGLGLYNAQGMGCVEVVR